MKHIYEKTQEDIRREESDLKNNSIMRWMQNQDAFKFNVGDILIKKNRVYHWDNPHNIEWKTETVSTAVSAPKKYIYIFENKLGIGYLRQLKSSGNGTCGALICVANFDPEFTRFELDPDFVDHTLIGDGEFDYNQQYLNKKKFRQDAIKANKGLLVKTSSRKGLRNWFLGLNVGDEFWFGKTYDELVVNKYKVIEIIKPTHRDLPSLRGRADDFLTDAEWRIIEIQVLETDERRNMRIGTRMHMRISQFHWEKVAVSKPYPIKDTLCDQQK